MTRDDILQRIEADLPSAIRLFQRSGVDIAILRELAAKYLDVPGVPLFLASMPETPSRIQLMLIERGDFEVLRVLADNPNYIPRLMQHPSSEVRCCVASARHLPPALALQMCQDSAFEVRMALARNPVIPPNVQLKLSNDTVPMVRMALLDNRKLDEEFQIGLGDDIDTAVHLSTLLRPRLSYACMKIWAEFDEELGQLALARRSDLPEKIVELLTQSKYSSVRLELLKYQNLPEETLIRFANSPDSSVLLALLSRQALSAAVISAIWKSGAGIPAVLSELAQHPSLTDEIGVALAGDEAVRPLLAANASPELAAARRALILLNSSALSKILLANPCVQSESALLSMIIETCADEVLPHLAYRQIDCSQVSPAARERLKNSCLPTVKALTA